MPAQTWAGSYVPVSTPSIAANMPDPVYDNAATVYQPYTTTYNTYNGAQNSLFSTSMNSDSLMPSPYSLTSWSAPVYQGVSFDTSTSTADLWITYNGAPDISFYTNPIVQNPVTYAASPIIVNYAGYNPWDPADSAIENPEPATNLLVAGGIAALVWARRRIQNRRS